MDARARTIETESTKTEQAAAGVDKGLPFWRTGPGVELARDGGLGVRDGDRLLLCAHTQLTSWALTACVHAHTQALSLPQRQSHVFVHVRVCATNASSGSSTCTTRPPRPVRTGCVAFTLITA
jgi:hypothetical protein